MSGVYRDSDGILRPAPLPDDFYEGSPEWEALHKKAAKVAKGLLESQPKTQAGIVRERREKYEPRDQEGE